MKVLMICNSDAALYKFRMPIIRALKELGKTVITISGDTGYTEKLGECVDENYSIPMYGNEKISNLIKVVKYCRSTIAKERPDVIHGFTHFGNIVAGLSSFGTDAKLIMTVTGMGRLFVEENPNFITSIKKYVLQNAYRFLSKRASVIFVQNSTDSELLSRYVDSGKIMVQPGSGIEVKSLALKEIKSKEIKVLMASRKNREKGYLEYFKAAKLYQALHSNSNLSFSFAGGASLKDPFDRELNELCEDANVEYLGYVQDMDSLYNKYDVMILPSYYREGVPRSLLEALINDMYIITTNMPGCKETVIDGWNGALVEPKNVNALVSKFISLDLELLESCKGNSYNLALQKFDSQIIVNQTISSYEQC